MELGFYLKIKETQTLQNGLGINNKENLFQQNTSLLISANSF